MSTTAGLAPCGMRSQRPLVLARKSWLTRLLPRIRRGRFAPPVELDVRAAGKGQPKSA